MVRKNPKIDLRVKYQKTFEIALIISLALIIVAFKFFPDVQPPQKIMKVEQETFTTEDIDITKQENRPPPPPRPPIPIEAQATKRLMMLKLPAANYRSLKMSLLLPPGRKRKRFTSSQLKISPNQWVALLQFRELWCIRRLPNV